VEDFMCCSTSAFFRPYCVNGQLGCINGTTRCDNGQPGDAGARGR
jgi:hypothetical protein